ncbi:MAG: ferrochelatase [Acidobacteriia bacterium]|nr:ferrochelatase [Terriglobia bacterium]MYG04050.1 ferrochelatase [Terriglobia bacterium]MYK10343.1 ferrochelatase [Terriglobia bacterium]
MSAGGYDAILLVSFGGPERADDVVPFLENVVRGRGVPRERLLKVAEHYYEFGGRSPINDQNRSLIAALREELAVKGPSLPIYFGNRNWHPLLADTLSAMTRDGVQRALAFVTSAFGSYSGCRQYRENIDEAIKAAGGGAPRVDKIRPFFNHPGFIRSVAGRVRAALSQFDASDRAGVRLLFTAHSIPSSMAHTCDYVVQLCEASRLVSEQIGSDNWELVFQSRSGPPTQPWLEPDIGDRIDSLGAEGVRQVCVVPIGFLSDHIEVAYDLDFEAAARASTAGISLVRAETVGTCPVFVSAVCDLIRERVDGRPERACVGVLPVRPDECPKDCCPQPQRPGRAAGERSY